MGNNAQENLKTLKKNLLTPEKFKKDSQNFRGKACFSYNYKLYGCLETWDLALDKLRELPVNENIFHELILHDFKVKPYLDVEWYSEKFPELVPERVLLDIKEAIFDIFKKEWDFELKQNDIYVATCHRMKTEGFKYSFRIVVSTHSPMLVFNNTNAASYLAKRIRTLCKEKFNEEIVDMSVYKKTQNIRIINHCKHGEYIPMQKLNSADDDKEFVITCVDPIFSIIEVPEQKDVLYKNIKNIKGVDLEDTETLKFVLDKIKIIHPTAHVDRIDTNKFIQLNYTDKTECCFASKDRVHERIGFFCFLQDNLICVGCHSGNCVDDNNKKIIKILGSIASIKVDVYEKVDCNNKFTLDHAFVKRCIYDSALGVSNMFEEMYLKPKRIKWINDSKTGSTYYWDGNLWREDQYSFIERLIASNVVRVLRGFKQIYMDNSKEEGFTLDEDDETLIMCSKLISKLNEGTNLNNILKFLKPLLNDSEFDKIKDINPGLLSCKNGVIELKTGILRKCVPEDNMTKAIDISYDPHADSTDFEEFVKGITSSEAGPDEDLYNYVKWSVGYALQGNPIHKMFFILYGEQGYNGKSLFLNTIKNVLGFYAVTMDKSVVVSSPNKTAGSHSTELCQLENSRFGILSETKEDDIINDAQIKTLTGVTDKLSIREIYGKQKEFSPQFVPFISSNHKLKINLKDRAMYERLILLPFRLSFVENPSVTKSYERKGDIHLPEKLDKNKEGVLKWIVECSTYYHTNTDIKLPQVIIDAKNEYKREMDDYADFIARELQFTGSSQDTLDLGDIVRAFKNFCLDMNITFDKRKSEKLLSDNLKDYQINKTTKFKGVVFSDK
jgi:P4 family phage/plasmid primase-like protien